MIEKGTFCENCRAEIKYIEKDEVMSAELKGESYSFMGKRAFCADCGAEVCVSEIDDYNLKALYDAYRIKNSIISLEKILELPEKYEIEQNKLSLLLGWKEDTFSRYCDGDMPSKQDSDLLQKIYDGPDYFKSLLESKKDN